MKRSAIILSILGPIVLIGLGAVADVVGGANGSAPTDTEHLKILLLGILPGLVMIVVGWGQGLYLAAQHTLQRWFTGMVIWPLITVAFGLAMLLGFFALGRNWWVALAFWPLATLFFSMFGPRLPQTQAGYARGYNALASGRTADAVSERTGPVAGAFGALAVLTIAAGVLLQPSVIPGGGGPTPNINQGTLQVSPTTETANCAIGTYQPITLQNTGDQALTWQGDASDANVIINPSARGTIAAKASTTVTLAGTTRAASFTATFTASGNAVRVTITCSGS